ncbi:MAG: hypothetical protein KAR40_11580 [Candidatus Sabulitectum sp.]|nr:hypothetical protein [Candidatus Sabulitectum sp.]
MTNTKNKLRAVLILIAMAGCATRDNTDFQLFNIQTGVLAEETAVALESAQLLAETNLVEAINDGDRNLLENLVLQRENIFTLGTDSTSIAARLTEALSSADEAAGVMGIYTLLLAEMTESQNIAFKVNAAAGPRMGILTAAIAALVEHGTIEHDAERTGRAMQTASPAIDSISTAMAELTEAAANAVQATYADMAARRQMCIVTTGYPAEAVMELVTLNQQVTTLLHNLQVIHDAWLTIPSIHYELMSSLSETSISATLRILIERMNEIREEEL